MASRKTFGDLVQEVVRHREDTTLEEIRLTFNEFLREHDFKNIRVVKRDIVVTATDSFDLDEDIIAVKEVYLNDEKIKSISYKEYKEEEYSTNDYYLIFDGKIMFLDDLDTSDTLYLKAAISMDSQDDLTTSTELDFNNIWFNVAVNWICWELYQTPDNFDQYQTKRFERKYYVSLEKVGSQVLDENGYKAKGFEDIDLDYSW